MDLRSIYIANGVGIFILLMLYYVSQTKILSRHDEDRIYTFMIFGVMLGCFMEALSYTLDGRLFPGARVLNYIANTYLFSVNLLLPFSVLAYVDIGLYGDTKRIWKNYKPHIIIGIVMLLVNIVNFFIPVSYYITEQNVYERRPLSYVYYIIILFYAFSAMVVTKRYEKEFGAKTFFNINMFLIPILIGTGLQFAFYGLSLAWLSAAIGLTGLYMMQQNETAYIDSLLEIYNRKYLDFILDIWIKRGYSFAGMMIDIDYFKSINDRYGHSEGDNALRRLAGILKRSGSGSEWVFRFAGDEFIVLRISDAADGLDDYIRRLTENIEAFNESADAPYSLEISYGTSFFGSGKTDIDRFMKELDSGMYRMKTEHHQSREPYPEQHAPELHS